MEKERLLHDDKLQEQGIFLASSLSIAVVRDMKRNVRDTGMENGE